MRATAREIFLQALGECGVGDAIAGNVEVSRGLLRVCEDLYDLRTYSRIFVVAIGKASRGMAEALQHQMGSGLAGIVVQPETYTAAPMLAGFRHFNSGHPTPNAASFAAATAVLKWMRTQAENAFVIYLLSGGGSAMLEKPLDDALTLEDLGATHGALVHSGAPIAEINAVRKHLSAVKGGRLAETAERGGAAQQVSMMISDVPDTAPDALASGPTTPDGASRGRGGARQVRARRARRLRLPHRAEAAGQRGRRAVRRAVRDGVLEQHHARPRDGHRRLDRRADHHGDASRPPAQRRAPH